MFAIPVLLATVLLLGIAVALISAAKFNRTAFLNLALVLLAITAAAATYTLIKNDYNEAEKAADCAARVDGQPVRNLRKGAGFLGFQVTTLGVRAELARVSTTDPKTPIPRVWKERSVLYLGTADSSVFLYDRKKKRTFRLSAGSVVLSLNTAAPRFRPSLGCKPLA